MKEVLILGSGNAFNTDGRSHAAYWIRTDEGGAMLLDCGATTLMRMQQEALDFGLLDVILLTHFHGDHYGGLPFLLLQLQLLEKRTRPLLIAGPPGVQAHCQDLMETLYPGFEFQLDIQYLEMRAGSGTRRLENKSVFQVQGFAVAHRPESLAYRIQNGSHVLAFSGDSAWAPVLSELVDGVDLGLIELSMPSQPPDNPVDHVSLNQVLEQSQPMKAQRLVWVHIYDQLAEAARKEGLEIAFDGMRIVF